jgi:monoamine oxidase
MIQAAQAQLKEMHNQYYIPEPYTAMYHDWTDEPFGAGWHAWKAGFKYWEIMPKMRRPLPTENVYICGEAYSNNQGWVEGALQTAELMLEEYFGLKRPDWLPRDYDLGP